MRLYPKVFEDYLKSLEKEGNFRLMGSDIFFHGLIGRRDLRGQDRRGQGTGCQDCRMQEMQMKKASGIVVFEVNGNRSAVKIKDQAANLTSATFVTDRLCRCRTIRVRSEPTSRETSSRSWCRKAMKWKKSSRSRLSKP